ncbi:MAG: hypothetical protein IIB05_09075 [Bacteroidetes bacterium]|nr:hypothetical protein [Bacteroidota bacterium]
MKNSMLSILMVVTWSMFNSAIAQENISQPKLIALKFHADWCGSCKAMGPVFEDLSNKLDGKPVLFYKLDFTNNTTKHQSVMMASALGLDEALKENQGTGFILLIDPKSKKVLQKFTKDDGLKSIAGKINGYL